MQEKTRTAKSWWQTLPGVLTAISGIIAALTGLIGVLIQAGLLGETGARVPTEPHAPPLPAEQVAAVGTQPPSSPVPGRPLSAEADDTRAGPENTAGPDPAALDPRPIREAKAVLTTLTGETAMIEARSLYLGFSKDRKTLPLTNGQSVDFDKIRVIEVTGIAHTDLFEAYPDEAGQPEVRILLLTGETLTGTVAVPNGPLGTPYFFFSGTSAAGGFRIRPWEVAEIRFER